jgi:hypothetical protein
MRRMALPDQCPVLVDFTDALKRHYVRLSLRIGDLAGKIKAKRVNIIFSPTAQNQ